MFHDIVASSESMWSSRLLRKRFEISDIVLYFLCSLFFFLHLFQLTVLSLLQYQILIQDNCIFDILEMPNDFQSFPLSPGQDSASIIQLESTRLRTNRVLEKVIEALFVVPLTKWIYLFHTSDVKIFCSVVSPSFNHQNWNFIKLLI